MNDKRSILCIEPDQEFRKALRMTLQKAGHTVITARDGQEALTILSNNVFDLVISALRMPHVDGMELMEEVNRTRKGMPVIFLTAYGDVESYMDLMNMGAFDYLNKPVAVQEILRVTMNALGDKGNASLFANSSRANALANVGQL